MCRADWVQTYRCTGKNIAHPNRISERTQLGAPNATGYGSVERRENETTALIGVLLLEPDPWRFRGISAVLEDCAEIKVVGHRDFNRILRADEPPPEIEPHVCLVAHRLVAEHGLDVVPHVKILFGGAPVVVYGDHDCLHTSAEMTAVGASGYCHLGVPPGYLAKAVTAVARGRMWVSREAVALMTNRETQRAEKFGKKVD